MTVIVSVIIRKRPWNILVSTAHAYTKIIVWLLVPVFYPGSSSALAGCFPQAIVNVIEQNLRVTNPSGNEGVRKSELSIPYFLDYSAPLFSSRPRIDRALCPSLRVILRALE